MSFIPGTKPLPTDIAPRWSIEELKAARIKWFGILDDLAKAPFKPLPHNKASNGEIIVPERFLKRSLFANWRGYTVPVSMRPTFGGWIPFNIGAIANYHVHKFGVSQVFIVWATLWTGYVGKKLFEWEYSDPLNQLHKSVPYLEMSGQLTTGHLVGGFPTDYATHETIHHWAHGKAHDEKIQLTRAPMSYD